MIDTAALERSFHSLIMRHAILRTSFEERDGVSFQVVQDTVEFSLPMSVLGDETSADRDQALTAALRDAAREPFDLTHAPLLRVKLFRLGESDYALLIVIHHIVSDGWSLGVIAREIGQLYAKYSGSKAVDLPPLSMQYADYAAWQLDRLKGESSQMHAVYWRERLAGLQQVLLPADRPRAANRSHRGDVEQFEIPEQRLRCFERSLGARTLLLSWLYLRPSRQCCSATPGSRISLSSRQWHRAIVWS